MTSSFRHITVLLDEAVAALKRARYDVVFMDMRMPGMDGPAAARASTAGRGRPGSPPGRRGARRIR